MGERKTGMNEIKDLYERDKNFRKYVEAVAHDLGLSVNEVLQFDAIKKRAASIENEMEQR